MKLLFAQLIPFRESYISSVIIQYIFMDEKQKFRFSGSLSLVCDLSVPSQADYISAKVEGWLQ